MSHPFEYFDPAVNAPSHAAKVEISASPTPGSDHPRGPSPTSAAPAPSSQPSAPNPYKPSGASGSSSHPAGHGAVAAPKPAAPVSNPYAQPSSGSSHKNAPAPSSHQQPQPRNPYAPSTPTHAPSSAAGSNPYALPHQPSAPQGGFSGGAPNPYAPATKPSAASSQAASSPKAPQSAPSSGMGASVAVPSSHGGASSHGAQGKAFNMGPDVRLSDTARQRFLDYGFTLVSQVVPKPMITRALTAINRSLGRTPAANRTTTSCPELVASEPLLDLFHASGVASLATKLIGPGFHPPPHCFINIQYPGDGCTDEVPYEPSSSSNQKKPEAAAQPPASPRHTGDLTPIPHWSSFWKIDGLPAPASGPKDENHIIRNYSLLVGVFLSDITEEMSGNVTVWPGSHLGIQALLRARGGTVAALNAGKIDRPVVHNNQLESAPQQIVAKAGDVMLCHYQVAHTQAPNLGADIRYVVFFRVYAKAHQPLTMRPEAMDNVFLDFEGVYDLIGKSHPK